MIFFSDPSSEGMFSEEIRGAVNSGLSFYSYRMPNSAMFSFGSSEGYVEGIGEPGFLIGMFDPTIPIITIPYKGAKKNRTSEYSYNIPSASTSFEEYSQEIKDIIKALEGKEDRKIVAAKVTVRDAQLDLAETFFYFCKRFPSAFIFCFSTPATGCWIGASPELLLEGTSGQLHSMSLAGTRKVVEGSIWDDKNLQEQSIVTDYISDVFRNNNLEVELGETFTKQAGGIEHICTPINAKTGSLTPAVIEKLIKDLSPTPALCGYPKELAFEAISHLENFDRGCYGGFCGPYHSPVDFTLYVTIRCCSVNERKYCIYTGGGITCDSKVEDEWRETEMKLPL